MALLEVEKRFEDHQTAATWFTDQGLAVPKNCFVPGSSPASWDMTDGVLGADLAKRCAKLAPDIRIKLWDANYLERVKRWPLLLACKSHFLELSTPPVITDEDWVGWLGKRPATRNPGAQPEALWARLAERAGVAG